MKRKILIIHDDILALRTLKKSLEDDFEIRLENAGQRFAEHTDEYRQDMILLKADLPGMSGTEVFETWQKKTHEPTPVVMLVPILTPQTERTYLEKGLAGVLPADLPGPELAEKLKQIFFDHAGTQQKPHVLILGNDAANIRLTKLDLESAGLRVSAVLSVIEAIDILKQETVDAFLIAGPILNVSEKEVYDTICKRLSVRSLPVVYGSDSPGKDILLDKVDKVIGR